MKRLSHNLEVRSTCSNQLARVVALISAMGYSNRIFVKPWIRCMLEQMTKRELAEAIYNEALPAGHKWGVDKGVDIKLDALLLTVFTTEVGLTPAGAATYLRGCKRVSENLPFYYGTASGPRDTTPLDTSPDVEDTRPLYTVVFPRDVPEQNAVVVDSTHSFFSKADALANVAYDAIVVVGLPDLESNFLTLTPVTGV